eukprot:NODE_1401_length_1749_cov_108.954490_g1332_i0.p2 GENE.NODE_1401_length_1749_cov_108.954490_g1332_i0~~NODE_1401_length_1749_cov_108.954490_g1332_i0.p2  ORF type:complete len:202 (-),score=23.56 NODE_1401_length_1749_cov_108.954490_g1332_i0:394-999(-)
MPSSERVIVLIQAFTMLSGFCSTLFAIWSAVATFHHFHPFVYINSNQEDDDGVDSDFKSIATDDITIQTIYQSKTDQKDEPHTFQLDTLTFNDPDHDQLDSTASSGMYKDVDSPDSSHAHGSPGIDNPLSAICVRFQDFIKESFSGSLDSDSDEDDGEDIHESTVYTSPTRSVDAAARPSQVTNADQLNDRRSGLSVGFDF